MSTGHYDFELRLNDSKNVHAIQFRMVPHGSRVLDIGCHTGLLGVALATEKKCDVIGVDRDPNAIAIARERLLGAYTIDIESEGWPAELLRQLYDTDDARFDRIIFGDVLEHTREPERILREAAVLLKPEGKVIVSLPNVANLRVRLQLLRGRFEYEESGILDRTHLRFFTRESSQRLIERAGYQILETDYSGYSLPQPLIRLFPAMLAVQFVRLAGKC